VVGTEEAFDHETLAKLYRDHDDYVARYSRRLDELLAQHWLLSEGRRRDPRRGREGRRAVTDQPVLDGA